MGKEKRRHHRVPFVERATVITPEEKTYISKSEDLSLSGIFLVRGKTLPKGQKGLFVLSINTKKAKWILLCRL